MSLTPENSVQIEIQIVNPVKEDPIFTEILPKVANWFDCPGIRNKDVKFSEMDNATFHPDKFELVVDARGYSSQNLSCHVGPSCIEVVAQRQEGKPADPNCRVLSMTRNYQLPQDIDPVQTICYLSQDGVLLIQAPWVKQTSALTT